MARHLLEAGHDVALWSHTAAKATELAALGKGTACATPREVAEQADFIFLCVGDTDMSARVTLGEDGLAEGAKPGTIIADASTIAPSYARRAAETLAGRGVHFLDAPMTGSVPGATAGTLTFMIDLLPA